MPDPPFHSDVLRDLLPRLRAGDTCARDELIRAARSRVEDLARRMLRRYPAVARWADTDDVFQGSALRLLRALEEVPVDDTRQFLNLTAAVIRRELLDLARRFQGPNGVGANHASAPPDGPRPDPPAPTDDSTDLDQWAALHAAVERLPDEQREVFGLVFYHKWTQVQIAALLGVDERTVRRRWRAAGASLAAALGGGPDLGDES